MKIQMKALISMMRRRSFGLGITALALTAGSTKVAAVDLIPYPNGGTPNPTTYTFTAVASGDISAYFAGANAAFDTEIGMMVNGVSTGVVGLDDLTSTMGQKLDLGTVNAGDTIVFELINNSIGQTVYSDPSMNTAYDAAGENQGHNHIYSTAYTATTDINQPPVAPLLLSDNVPAGTYISWEDLPFTGGIGSEPVNVQNWEHSQGFNPTNADFDYNDLSVVVTDVATNVPDSTSTLTLLSIGLVGIGCLRRRLQTGK
jgi:hypothetical protein